MDGLPGKHIGSLPILLPQKGCDSLDNLCLGGFLLKLVGEGGSAWSSSREANSYLHVRVSFEDHD